MTATKAILLDDAVSAKVLETGEVIDITELDIATLDEACYFTCPKSGAKYEIVVKSVESQPEADTVTSEEEPETKGESVEDLISRVESGADTDAAIDSYLAGLSEEKQGDWKGPLPDWDKKGSAIFNDLGLTGDFGDFTRTLEQNGALKITGKEVAIKIDKAIEVVYEQYEDAGTSPDAGGPVGTDTDVGTDSLGGEMETMPEAKSKYRDERHEAIAAVFAKYF